MGSVTTFVCFVCNRMKELFDIFRVENPTQLRVRRWSFNCKELLSDPTGVREFMKFCKADFSTESLNFYLHVQEIRNCPLSQIKQKAEVVYRFVIN
jgi:hypothetical protein